MSTSPATPHESTVAQPPRFGRDAAETRRVVLESVRVRFWRAVNFLSVFVFVFVVYVGALLSEMGILAIANWSLSEDIQKYKIVSIANDVFRVSTALLSIVLSVVHSIRGAIEQYHLDRKLMGEGEP